MPKAGGQVEGWGRLFPAVPLEARAAYFSMPEIIRSSANSKRSSGFEVEDQVERTRGCAGTFSG